MTSQQTLQTEEYKQTELGDLPKDWSVQKIQDFVDFERGAEPGSENYNDKGNGIRFLRVSDISGNRKEYIFTTSNKIKICSPENVLITFDGSPGIVKKGFTGAFSSGIRKVNLINNSVDLDFVFYVLQTEFVQKEILKHSTGVTIKHASKSIPHIRIPFPPLPEQQKIAYVLSTIQNAQEKTDNFINSLKELKKSSMKHLFTYGAVSFDEADKVELKETEIGMIPRSWEETNVKSYCSQILTGGTPKTEIKEYYEPQEIPWMKSGEIQGLRIKKIETFISKKGLENSNARILPKNSVVIALAGRGKTRGTTSILEIECTCNQSVVCMVPNEKLSYEFLHYHLSNIYFYIRNLTGDKDRTGLNKEIVGKLPLNLPSFPEQQKISSILSAIDSKIEAEESKKKALGELFNSMLKDLMTAKIRVNNLGVSA